jgi:hypothetical protein
MRLPKPVRSLAVVTAIFALLLFGTAAGEACEAWQHHECAANPLCPICHLGQQVAESAAGGPPVAAPERLGLLAAPQEPLFVSDFRSPLFVSRAPPVF